MDAKTEEMVVKLITSTEYKDRLIGEYYYKLEIHNERAEFLEKWKEALRNKDEAFNPHMGFENFQCLVGLSFKELDILKELLKEEGIDVSNNCFAGSANSRSDETGGI